jgi:hypothetical protein
VACSAHYQGIQENYIRNTEMYGIQRITKIKLEATDAVMLGGI